jgi:hypothetical protein
VLTEVTLRHLTSATGVDHRDFLARADLLRVLGFDVLISRFRRYFHLVDYLATYTDQPIGIAVGLPSLTEIANERYYEDLAGGLLESIGRLFKRSVQMYVYPALDAATGRVLTVETLPVQESWRHLRSFLLERRHLVPIHGYDERLLTISGKDVLARIRSADPAWEAMVPAAVAATIKIQRLFRSDS